MVGQDHLTLHVGFVDFTPLLVYSSIMDPRRLFQVSLGRLQQEIASKPFYRSTALEYTCGPNSWKYTQNTAYVIVRHNNSLSLIKSRKPGHDVNHPEHQQNRQAAVKLLCRCGRPRALQAQTHPLVRAGQFALHSVTVKATSFHSEYEPAVKMIKVRQSGEFKCL